MAERQVLGDAIDVGLVDDGDFAQAAAALGALGLEEVAAPGFVTEHFAARGDPEALGYRLLRFDAFRTTHKIELISLKKDAQYRSLTRDKQGLFFNFLGIFRHT